MKRVLFTIIVYLIVFNTRIYADCIDYFRVWPNKGELIQNPIIILDIMGAAQDYAYELDSTFQPYLINEVHKVKLKSIEIIKGQYQLTQVILKPEEILIAGKEYEFFMDNIPDYALPMKWNIEKNEEEPIKWKVLSLFDQKPPKWKVKPIEIGKEYNLYGCGPEMYVVFKYKAKDNSGIFVKASVKSLSTDKESKIIIFPYEGSLNVGHGMCSGGFTFEEGKEYDVAFELIDFAGNSIQWTGERIKFTKPEESSE